MLERKQQQREKKYKDSCIKAVYTDVLASENGMSDSTMTFTGTLIPSKNDDFFCLSLNDDNTNLVLFENHSATELDGVSDVRGKIDCIGAGRCLSERFITTYTQSSRRLHALRLLSFFKKAFFCLTV